MESNWHKGLPTVFWINLNRSKDRRERMHNLLGSFNISNIRVQGVDAIEERDLLLQLVKPDPRISLLENACTYSHLLALKKFLATTEEAGLICEDDLSFEFVHLWPDSFNNIIASAPAHWEVLQLCHMVPAQARHIMEKGGSWIPYSEFSGLCFSALSYLISRKGAEKILNQFNWEAVDLFNRKLDRGTSEVVLFDTLQCYTYRTPLFTYPDDNDSTIHNLHLPFHVDAKNFAKHLWNENKLHKLN